MRAIIAFQMDRPVDKTKHYINPGGYEVETKDGKTYCFDFMDSCGGIREGHSEIIDFELKNADTETFPEIEELRKHLHEVTKITECFVYTGEYDEPEIFPEKILEFTIYDSMNTSEKTPESTEYVDVTVMGEDKDEKIIAYRFTERLLKEVVLGN